MIEQIGKTCCGCAACENICPKHCITMTKDKEGFLYPSVQESACVRCGNCEKVCPVLHSGKLNDSKLKEAWAVKSKDQAIVLNSSSGGLFSELACTVILGGGCVFGVSFSPDFQMVQHIMVEDLDGLKTLRGSKYIQSNVGNCFRKVREELEKGREVLFTGTPCQNAGLRFFLGREYDLLVQIDIICHGVPSPLCWQRYLKNLEEKTNQKVMCVDFRNKDNGWNSFGMKMSFCGGEVYYQTHHNDPFFMFYLKNICLRESCYSCKVKENGIATDITIGDFWGVSNLIPDMDSKMGISLALIHTNKGESLFKRIQSSVTAKKVCYESAISYNTALKKSVNRPNERDTFYSDMLSIQWNSFIKKYTKDRFGAIVRRKVNDCIIDRIKRKMGWENG